MKNIIFDCVEIQKELVLIFLCGIKFDEKSDSDKRTVLKKYIESIHQSYKVIILEENFYFRETTKQYLSYDDIFLKDLFDVELLTSLLVDKIFIIHEGISTAAELGLFASDEIIAKKTCLIVPDEYNVEEKKITKFIELAFFKKRRLTDVIHYYPITRKNNISENRIDYHTYFFDDVIGLNLKDKIKNSIKNNVNRNINLNIKKAKYNNKKNKNCYSVNKKKYEIEIYLDTELLIAQLISLFNNKEFSNRMRKTNKIKDSVTELQISYERIFKQTIAEIEGIDIDKYNFIFNISSKLNIKFRAVIGYVLYILQAAEFVVLPVNGEKMKIKPKFEGIYTKYNKCLKKNETKKLSFLEG